MAKCRYFILSERSPEKEEIEAFLSEIKAFGALTASIDFVGDLPGGRCVDIVLSQTACVRAAVNSLRSASNLVLQ